VLADSSEQKAQVRLASVAGHRRHVSTSRQLRSGLRRRCVRA
jgi:hypothetical protein